jgi:predicted amino acid-binding ACT domain protein
MTAELLQAKNELWKWVDDRAVTLLRLPLRGRTNFGRLGVFGLFLDEDTLEVTVTGLDSPGILAYLVGAFKKFDLNIESCAGERLVKTQGSHFEFSAGPSNLDKLAQLYDYLLRDDNFRLQRAVAFDRLYDLFVEFSHDRVGLLHPLASVLAENSVNLRKFRADKEDLFTLTPDVDAPVSVSARLEVPVGLDLGWLHEQLLEGCPDDSEVTFRSVVELVDGRPAKTNRVVTLQK